MRVEYPIAIDNNYAVWDAFANQFWPALYFVDAIGGIRHHHFGEGGYEESERVLQQLLNEAGATDTGSELVSVDASGAEVAADWDDLESTETYLGFGRATGFASSGGVQRDSSREYAAPAALRVNHWALSGKWRFENEAVVLDDDRGSIVYKWHARDLHLVMGPASAATPIRPSVVLANLPVEVWSWLAQMAQNGGGFYSHEWLQNLAGFNFHSADRIVPEWQDVEVGDINALMERRMLYGIRDRAESRASRSACEAALPCWARLCAGMGARLGAITATYGGLPRPLANSHQNACRELHLTATVGGLLRTPSWKPPHNPPFRSTST